MCYRTKQSSSDIYLRVLGISILPQALQQLQSAKGKVQFYGPIVAPPATQLTGNLDRSSCHSVKRNQNDWMLFLAAVAKYISNVGSTFVPEMGVRAGFSKASF